MKNKRYAFTLVELLISISITAALGIAVYGFMSSANKNSAKTRCRGMLRQNVQLAVRQLEKDITSSRAILVKAKDESGNDIKRPQMTVKPDSPEGPTVVTMETSIIDADDSSVNYFDEQEEGKDQEKDLYETVTYTLNNGVLMREGKEKRFKVADNIASITFAMNAIDSIDVNYDGKIEFTVGAKAKPDGSNDEIAHCEQVIVAIRQLQNKLLKDRDARQNPHWKQRIEAGNY